MGVGAAGAAAHPRRRLDDAVQRPDHVPDTGAQHTHQACHTVELRRRAGRALGEGGRRGEGGGGAAATVAAA